MSKSRNIEPYVIHCMIMRLTDAESLQHLTELGFKIKQRKLSEVKKQIKDSRYERLRFIAQEGFIDQHLERMAQLELVNLEMWKQYRAGNYRATDILRAIAEVQYNLSQFYDSTKQVMESNLSKGNSAKESLPVVQST